MQNLLSHYFCIFLTIFLGVKIASHHFPLQWVGKSENLNLKILKCSQCLSNSLISRKKKSETSDFFYHTFHLPTSYGGVITAWPSPERTGWASLSCPIKLVVFLLSVPAQTTGIFKITAAVILRKRTFVMNKKSENY